MGGLVAAIAVLVGVVIVSSRGGEGAPSEGGSLASGEQVHAAVEDRILSSDNGGRTFRTRYQGS